MTNVDELFNEINVGVAQILAENKALKEELAKKDAEIERLNGLIIRLAELACEGYGEDDESDEEFLEARA